ncbi:hypothetical protein E2C01_040629 [Portunus trituberculatus]|uniref:Uncharacterized protein n=1 Tax=Portunus trituberculatus TaxID=210409 RepID=A0A5B7FNH8_PORTR|nr:hypothetical protein [Portunus trituberculatus]
MKIVIKDGKRCNIPSVRKRLKTVRGGELMSCRAFDSTLSILVEKENWTLKAMNNTGAVFLPDPKTHSLWIIVMPCL